MKKLSTGNRTPHFKLKDQNGQDVGLSDMGIIRSSFLIGDIGNIENAWCKISSKNTVPEPMQVLD